MSTCSSSSSSCAVECDWYGNVRMHHLVGYRYPEHPDVPALIALLQMNPHAASATNQFQRLPLHYALDRCKPDFEVVQILCESYPAGVIHRDNDNNSPFDIAVKWNHPTEIMRLLVKSNPAVSRVYPTLYLTLTYGAFMGTIMGYLMGVQLMNTNGPEHYGQTRYTITRSINPVEDDDDDDDDDLVDRSMTDNTVSTSCEERDELY